MTVVFQNNPIKRQSWPMKAMQNLFQGNLNRLIINHYIRYKYRFKMKKHLFTIGILSVLLITTGCKQTEEKARHIPAAPQMEAQIDRSEPVKIVDVEQASRLSLIHI